MIRLELNVLIEKLHPICKHIVEMAAAECVSKQHAEITVSHLLKTMLETPLCDAKNIIVKANIDHEKLIESLTDYAYPAQTAQQSYPTFSPLLVELLQDGWLLSTSDLKQNSLRSGALLLAILYAPTRYFTPNVVQVLSEINRSLVLQSFDDWTRDSSETDVSSQDNEMTNNNKEPASQTPLLDKYAVDVTSLAEQGKLDPVLCRDAEIDLMIDILCRRRKNNPIVVGEAGVGKSALIEGLALRITSGEVPEKLRNNRLKTLDLGSLQAGASVKGEFEKRFKGIMSEVIASSIPIILFIDEAHTLIGAGNQQGGLDVSNLLKPALARGELKTIAATTWSEYKKYFEKDAALSRRFQLVKVDEPTADEAAVILRGLRTIYEQSHSVLIDDEAIKAAAFLSDRYLSGRQLPDKAIDVLDTACARVSINLSSPPKILSALKNQIHQIEQEKQLLNREQLMGINQDAPAELELKEAELANLEGQVAKIESDWHLQLECVQSIIQLRAKLITQSELGVENNHTFNESESIGEIVETNKSASELQDAEETPKEELIAELLRLNAKLVELQEASSVLVTPHVDKKQIANVIAEWTGVPVNRISQSELNVITELPTYLSEVIKGQELAIAHLHKHLLTSRADLRRPGRPLGAFLLVGPSGVGKTETVLQIADLLFGGKGYLTTINMSEFQEKHTVSRLIGSPPGYVGFGEGGILTEAIRQKPYSVVLLDEVEKAHPDVLNLFYQAFDKGEMADGEGRLIDCKNIVFFLTSNLGYQTIVSHAERTLGIDLLEALYPELADFFKPALLARMEVIPYLPLSTETLNLIVDNKLSRIVEIFQSRFNAEVEFSNDVKNTIISKATRTENGARMLESIIDGELLPPVSLILLQKLARSEPIGLVTITVENGQFNATIGA